MQTGKRKANLLAQIFGNIDHCLVENRGENPIYCLYWNAAKTNIWITHPWTQKKFERMDCHIRFEAMRFFLLQIVSKMINWLKANHQLDFNIYNLEYEIQYQDLIYFLSKTLMEFLTEKKSKQTTFSIENQLKVTAFSSTQATLCFRDLAKLNLPMVVRF